jgi:hypothetical protein
MSVLRH